MNLIFEFASKFEFKKKNLFDVTQNLWHAVHIISYDRLHLRCKIPFPFIFHNLNDDISCLYFQGIIKAKFCNHSMCLECLQKCKPDEKCKELSCPNTKLPSKYYFEYLISSLCSKKIDKVIFNIVLDFV